MKDHHSDVDRMVICMIRPSVDKADVTSPVAASAIVTDSPDASEHGAQLRSVLEEDKDVFPVELPSELPPERTVFYKCTEGGSRATS